MNNPSSKLPKLLPFPERNEKKYIFRHFHAWRREEIEFPEKKYQSPQNPVIPT